MSTPAFNQFNISGSSQIAGQATVYVTMPGNFFNLPVDNPPNIDPVPGLIFVAGNVSFGTDQFGNVRAVSRNIDGSLPSL